MVEKFIYIEIICTLSKVQVSNGYNKVFQIVDCTMTNIQNIRLQKIVCFVPYFHNSRKPQINFRLHLQLLNFHFYRENFGIFSCLFPGSINNSVINVSFGIFSNCGIKKPEQSQIGLPRFSSFPDKGIRYFLFFQLADKLIHR